MTEPQDPLVDAFYVALGRRVQTERAGRSMTQEALARRIGLTRSSVANLEAGRQKIQVHILVSIASALRVDLDRLIPESERGSEELITEVNKQLEGQPESTRRFVLNSLRMIPEEEQA